MFGDAETSTKNREDNTVGDSKGGGDSRGRSTYLLQYPARDIIDARMWADSSALAPIGRPDHRGKRPVEGSIGSVSTASTSKTREPTEALRAATASSSWERRRWCIEEQDTAEVSRGRGLRYYLVF